MIGKVAGESPLYLFDRLVAEPMQITHYGLRPRSDGACLRRRAAALFLPRDSS